MSQDNKKKEFNETLAELVEFATVSGNRITKDQVRLYFKDIVDDDKYEFIYNYLTGLKIEIEGYSQSSKPAVMAEAKEDKTEAIGKAETQEAKAFYDMYIEDLQAIGTKAESIEIKTELLIKTLEGDTKARESLTNIYLPKVISISEEYLNSPLGRSDLVAEGNLALFEAGVYYKGKADIAEFEKYIDEKIRKGIERAVYEELGSSRTSDHLVERINALNDASTEMAKELGREASLKELADRLALPEEEIKELMKISIDALTVDESGQ